MVMVTPVFEAGEAPIEGADRDSLAAGLRRHGLRNVDVVEGPSDLAQKLENVVQDGDVVVCLGAGSITKWAYELPNLLQRHLGLDA